MIQKTLILETQRYKVISSSEIFLMLSLQLGFSFLLWKTSYICQAFELF